LEPEPAPPEEPEELPLGDWTLPPTESSFYEPDKMAPESLEPAHPAAKELTERSPGKVSDLIGYLGELSSFLPEDKRKLLIDDDIPLKMQRIRNTLTGTLTSGYSASSWPVKGESATTTKQKLQALMGRLKEKLAE